MDILGGHECQLLEVAQDAVDGPHSREHYRALYIMHNTPGAQEHGAKASDLVITDMWLGRLTGIAGVLAETVKRLAAEVERERGRADQAERHYQEMIELADDAITVATRLGSHALNRTPPAPHDHAWDGIGDCTIAGCLANANVTPSGPADPDDSGAWGVRS